MSTDFTPKKDGSDPLVRPPLSVRLDGFDALSEGAQQVVVENSDQINRFIYRNRQDVANSSNAIHKSVLSHPDVDVTYQNHYGTERLTVTPRPRSVGQLEVIGGAPDQDVPTYDFAYEPITPETLLLVVLYKTNHMQAYDMGSLSSKGGTASAASVGAAVKLSGTDFGTGQINTCQMSFSGLGVIMSGVDWTGQGTGGKMMISTTALFDCIATDGSSAAVPILAGSASVTKAGITATIYSAVGEYKLDTSQKTAWTQSQGKPQHGMPYALKPDGTSYFVGSYYGVSVNQPGAASDVDDNATSGTGDAGVDSQLGTLGTDAQWQDKQMPTSWIYTLEERSDTDDIEGKLVITELPTYVSFITVSAWAGGKWNTTTYRHSTGSAAITYGAMNAADDPIDVARTIGAAYWVSGSFGAEPTVHDYKKAIYPGLYNVFDVSRITLTRKLGTKTLSDLTSTLPRAAFDVTSKDKPVDVVLDPVQASATGQPVLSQTAATDLQPPGYTLLGLDNVQPVHTDFTNTLPVDQFGGHYGFTSGGTEDKLTGGHEVVAYFGSTTPKAIKDILARPGGGFYPDAASALAAAQPFFAQTGGSIVGQSETETTIYTESVGRGAFAGADETTTVTQGANFDTTGPVTAFRIKQGGVDVKFTLQSSWAWNGQTGDATKALTYYPWPPGPVNGKEANCYFSTMTVAPPSDPDADVAGGGDLPGGGAGKQPDPELTTPFKKLAGAFTPWLHVSNHDHYIQGFNVTTQAQQDAQQRGTFYLFLDDSGADFMAFLKKDLGIEDTDVAACYMDIPARVYARITKILT